jgi:signal transduction histidine kinase
MASRTRPSARARTLVQDAITTERRRIARELHDTVVHGLTLIVLQSTAIRRRPDMTAGVIGALELLEEHAHRALVELRQALGQLDTAPGSAEIGALVDRVSRTAVPVRLEVRGEPGPVHADADLAAYRVVQEAVTNALRHGAPDPIIDIGFTWADQVEISVLSRPGRGLGGLREQVVQAGGGLETTRLADGGFRLTARLPRTSEPVR